MAQTPKACRFDAPKKFDGEKNLDSEITNCSGNAAEKAVKTGGEKAEEAVREVEADVDKALAHEQEEGEGEGAGVVPDRGTGSIIQPPDSEQDQTPAILPKHIITGDQGALTSKLTDSGDPPPDTTGQPQLTENLLSQSRH